MPTIVLRVITFGCGTACSWLLAGIANSQQQIANSQIWLTLFIIKQSQLSCHLVKHLLLALTRVWVEVLFLFFFLAVFLFAGRLRETQGLQLFNRCYLPCGETLTLSLKAFDGNELLDINLLAATEGIVAAIGYLQTWIDGICQQQLL